MPQEELNTRSIAGLILKNHIALYRGKLHPDSLSYVKAAILPAISYQEDMLRRTATQVVSMIMAIQGPASWPEGLEQLISLMDSHHVEGAEVSSAV